MRLTTTCAVAAIGSIAALTAAAQPSAGAAPHPSTASTHAYALTAPGLAANDEFGQSIAVSGDTLAVGAPEHNANHGAVYVYTRRSSGWRAMAKPTAILTLPGTDSANFGYYVAMQGRTIVVGASGQSTGSAAPGAADVFIEPKAGWHSTSHPTAILSPPTTATPEGDFASIVAISGSTIVAGAQDSTVDGNPYAGAAYVYSKPGSGWKSTSHGSKLTASDEQADAYVGGFLAVSGSTVVLGAFGHTPPSEPDEGIAYVYQKPPAGWKDSTETASLIGSDSTADDEFGESIAADGTTIAIGAPEKENGTGPKGAVYVFRTPKGGWPHGVHTSSIRLTPSQTGTNNYGESLAVSGPAIAVGATESTVGTTGDAGLAYVFGKPAHGWETTSASLVVGEPNPGAEHYFGEVALSDGVFAASSLEGGSVGQGSAYVYAGPAPKLTHVSQAKPRWTAGHHSVAINPKHSPHGGTHFSFTASEAATVTLSFSEKKHGHVKPKGTITVTVNAGKNTVYVDGPLGHGHKLKPGKGKVDITASNSYGMSHSTTLHFTVT